MGSFTQYVEFRKRTASSFVWSNYSRTNIMDNCCRRFAAMRSIGHAICGLTPAAMCCRRFAAGCASDHHCVLNDICGRLETPCILHGAPLCLTPIPFHEAFLQRSAISREAAAADSRGA